MFKNDLGSFETEILKILKNIHPYPEIRRTFESIMQRRSDMRMHSNWKYF